MFNINSMPSPLKFYTTVLDSQPQLPTTSNNQISTNIQRIQNVSDSPKTLQNMIPDAIFIDNIAPYLSIEDLENFNKAEVYPKINPYYQFDKELLEWKKMFSKGKNEKRSMALTRIRYCIKKQHQTLNLRNLNLTSLPNLQSATFITSLLYDGNNSQPIIDSFEKRHGAPLTFNLKKSSFLPKNITTIVIDTVKNIDFIPKQYSQNYLPSDNHSVYHHYKTKCHGKTFFEKCWDWKNDKSENFFISSTF